MELLLKMKTVPILNENDVTTFDEIKFGDNDNLSAHIASLLNADKLLLLTDVGGVYDSNPKENPNAKCLRVIEKVDESILSLADGGSDKGIGGMESKLKSAQFLVRGASVISVSAQTEKLIHHKKISSHSFIHATLWINLCPMILLNKGQLGKSSFF